MDPSKPESFNHKTEILSTGRKYHFIDNKPDGYDPLKTVTLLLVHGFPDLWYGWRYQIGPWVKAGYRVVAPDMLGYGGTDQPQETAEYTTKKLSDDLVALLDLLGVQKAVLIGHDWGSAIVGRFALWHPNRLLALIHLSVAFTGGRAPQYISLEEMTGWDSNFGYMLYFADQSSTKEINANMKVFLKFLYAQSFSEYRVLEKGSLRSLITGERPFDQNTLHRIGLLSDEELNYHISQNSTMHGPLCYYRTTKLRFEEEEACNLPDRLRADLPVLFIRGARDPASPAQHVELMRKLIPDLEVISLEAGHWIMLEDPERVVEKVLTWLRRVSL